MISFRHRGDFSRLTEYLTKLSKTSRLDILNKYGQAGVAALSANTPVDTGLTASSWSYEISDKKGNIAITFYNSNVNKGVSIAIILQYGHGTRNGGYVQGRDYINPAIQPVFDQMANELWEEVTKL